MPVAKRAAKNQDLEGEAYLQLILAIDEIDDPMNNIGLIYCKIQRKLKDFIARDRVISVDYNTLLYKKIPKRRDEVDIEQIFDGFEATDLKDYIDTLGLITLDKVIVGLLCDGTNIKQISDILGYRREDIYLRIKIIKEKLNGRMLQEV